MANICVIGSLKAPKEDLAEGLRTFVTCLSEEIVRKGHRLYTGCLNDLDELIARSAFTWLEEHPDELKEFGLDLSSRDRITSYVIDGGDPVQTAYGKVLSSELRDWEKPQERVLVPEQIAEADAVVVIGGSTGTRMGADWANIINKPLLPLTAFGGTAAEVYKEEVKKFDKKYGDREDLKEQYTSLNQIKPDWKVLATDVVDLADRLTSSRDVFVIMSFSEEKKLTYALKCFERVCREHGYTCSPINEINAKERILPEIKERIQRAAFVIADLTEPRPNVYYELGYAEGLGKRVILTAYEGTELPFDVKDMPTLFWEWDLEEKLTAKMAHIT